MHWRETVFYFQIQFWKTHEGKSSIKEHIIIYEERPPCLSAVSHYNPMSSKGGATEHQFTGSTLTYGHVYNLWPATPITARIVAINGMYDGPPSGEITFVTSEGGKSIDVLRKFDFHFRNSVAEDDSPSWRGFNEIKTDLHSAIASLQYQYRV